MGVNVFVKLRQGQTTDLRMLLADFCDEIESLSVTKTQIHEDHVGRGFFDCLTGFRHRASLADATRGERVRLGASEFSMERGARFRAVLKVRAGGREICRDITS
jgi:hypothetical protein